MHIIIGTWDTFMPTWSNAHFVQHDFTQAELAHHIHSHTRQRHLRHQDSFAVKHRCLIVWTHKSQNSAWELFASPQHCWQPFEHFIRLHVSFWRSNPPPASLFSPNWVMTGRQSWCILLQLHLQYQSSILTEASVRCVSLFKYGWCERITLTSTIMVK